MKKLITIFVFLMMIASTLAVAPPTPGPVKGTVLVDGSPASGSVIVKNERTLEILTKEDVASLTLENGIYTFDISKFKQEYIPASAVYEGDTLTVLYGTSAISFKVDKIPYIVEALGAAETVEDEEEVDSLSANEAKTSASIDLLYGQEVNLVIANNKITKLVDSEIKFNSENYDVKEEVTLIGSLKTSIDDVDYLLDSYLEIEELSYAYIFDDLIDLAEIDIEEILEIKFLGKTLRISKASADSITVISGKEYNLMEGDAVDIGGIALTVKIISDSAVSLSYNGQVETIDEGEIGEVGGIEVYVEDAIENDDGTDLATMRIGIDIEEVIEDGDDYNDKFVWVIDMPNSIGIINEDPFNDLEDNPPIKAGEVISLPEEFLDIKLSVPNVNMYDLDIEVDGSYLLIEGDFSKGTEDYTEVYLNANGFYDEDDVFIGTSIEIGDSNIALEMGSLKVGNLVIKLDMSDIIHNGISYLTKDEDFLDYLGVIFKDPERAIEDQKNFQVSVPEERPEATIIIGEDIPADEVAVCPELVCDEVTCQDTVCPDCPSVECPAEVICDECTEGEDGNIIVNLIVGILSAAGGAGVFFKLFNNKIFLGANTGVKSYRGRNGDLKLLHKHPGTKGYHNPETLHRGKEGHPRGMVDVAKGYQKDSNGDWEYVG